MVNELGKNHRKKSQKHLAFLFTHGFAARMVLRSGIAKSLISQGIKVTAISPNASELYFQTECEQEGVILEQSPHSISRISNFFRSYRSYFLDDIINNTALKTKHKDKFKGHHHIGNVMTKINRISHKNVLLRSTYIVFERLVNRSKKVKEFLLDINPDFLVLPNPFGTEEVIYLIHAKDIGIPVICQMLSWDNITSKGTPLLMPEYFISWGPVMTQEMIDLYRFPKERIYECGVPHFDVYFQQENFFPCTMLLQELGLPEEHPYIFYGMVAPYSCPNELDILSWLVNKINSNAFVRPCSLVIRPHPQTIWGSYARDKQELEKLQGLVGPRVALDIPPVLSDRLAWDLPKTDMYRLASLLSGSAMCLNAGSTLCLEACILDRPVIYIGFDGWTELPYDRSTRRGLDYTHIVKLLAMGGVRVARSFSDLVECMNAYLQDPYLDREGRKQVAMQECGLQDGRATERVVSTLLALIQASAQDQ
jgi:hypothetical protein